MAKKNPAKLPAIRQRKGRGNPNPLPPPAEYRFKPGQSGNPSGRPKSLGGAYKRWLETVNEKDPQGRTNAELIAAAMGLQAMKGDVPAAREIRAATEGTKITGGWQSEIIDLLRAGELAPAQVLAELGEDDARPLLIAAGFSRDEGRETNQASQEAGHE